MNHNPYPGLRPFEAGDHRFFFGREAQVDELLDRLDRDHFLAVVGVSGSGKSSLVRAGLVPALRSGFIASAGPRWRTVVLRPGVDPMRSLWDSLVQNVIPKSLTSKQLMELRETFQLNGRSLIEIADFLKGGQDGEHDSNLLIVIDQFEEVFTLSRSHYNSYSLPDKSVEEQFEPARAFVDRLMKASQQSDIPIYVVITMRSDYLGDCARFRDFPELLNRGQYLIPRMTVDELRDAIRQPAKLGQPWGRVGQPLINQLLNDLNDEPRNLPRLQHVLMRTWEVWANRFTQMDSAQDTDELRYLSLDDYEKVGEFDGALDQHADEVFADLEDEKQKILAELIFKRITAQDVSNRFVRRPAEMTDIYALLGATNAEDKYKVKDLLDRFMIDRVSFITSPDLQEVPGSEEIVSSEKRSSALTSGSIIELTHESLMYGWRKLQFWVGEEAKSAGQYQRIAQGARDHKLGRRGWLQAGELDYVEEFTNDPVKGWTETWSTRYKLCGDSGPDNPDWRNVEAFLQGSVRQRWLSLLKKTAMFGVLVLAVAFVWAFVTYANTKRAEDYASQSEYQRAKLGGKTQEFAALLDIQSFKTQVTPANTDLAAWESFDRIVRGVPLPTKDVRRIDRIFLAPDEENHDPNMLRIVALFAPRDLDHSQLLPQDLEHPVPPLVLRSDTYAEDLQSNPESSSSSKSKWFAAISPSGRYAATSCEGGKLNLWDLSGPRLTKLRVVDCGTTPVLIVEPSRARLASEFSRLAIVEYRNPPPDSSDEISGSIRVVEGPGHGKPLFDRDKIALLNEGISEDGRYLAFVRKKGQLEKQGPGVVLTLVDLSSGTEFLVDGVSDDAPFDFSADGRFLAVGMADGNITMVDLRKLSQTRLEVIRHSTLRTHYPISAIAFSNNPQNMLLAYSEDGHDNVLRVVSYRATGGKVEARLLWSDFFGRKIAHLSFSPTDRFLGLAVGENTARVKIATTGFETARVSHSDRATWIAFSPNPDDNSVFSSSANGELLRFTSDHAHPPDIAQFDCTNPQQVSVGNKGQLAAVSCLQILDRPSRRNKKQHVAPVAKVFRFGERSEDFQSIIDPKPAIGWDIDRQGIPCHVAAATDAAIVATECDAKIQLLDVASGTSAVVPGDFARGDSDSKQCQRSPRSLALAANGMMLAVGDDCGRILIFRFDPQTRLVKKADEVKVDKKGTSLDGDSSKQAKTKIEFTALAFSNDSRIIAAGTADGVLKLMTVKSPMRDLSWSPTPPYEGSIAAIQFGPNESSRIIVGSGRSAHVLSVTDGVDLVHISDRDDNISAVTFSAKADWAAASTLKGRTHILDFSSHGWFAKLGNRAEALAMRLCCGYDPLANPAADEILSGQQTVHALQIVDSQNELSQESRPILMVWGNLDQVLAKDDLDEASRTLALTQHRLDISDRLADICSYLRTDLEVSGVTYAKTCGEIAKKR